MPVMPTARAFGPARDKMASADTTKVLRAAVFRSKLGFDNISTEDRAVVANHGFPKQEAILDRCRGYWIEV